MSQKHYNATEVAKYFIYLASREIIGEQDEREGITNLKLQKILYFAQAYYLAEQKRSLFTDEIQAWDYGPVVPSVYQEYKGNANQPIVHISDDSNISEDDKEELKKIWEAFGMYSASHLVHITHNHEPWKNAYSSNEKVISKEEIQSYYTGLFSE